MEESTSNQRLWREVKARWPRYYIGYGGLFLVSILAIGLAISVGWTGLATFFFVFLLILVYFLAASLWTANQINDYSALGLAVQALVPIPANAHIVDINLGSLQFAQWLSRQLLTGKVIAIDVFNPQSAPSRPLARSRQMEVRPAVDPRLAIKQSPLNMLPLPDGRVPLVAAVFSLSELWQLGDKLQLLAEIQRIMEPGGRLILVEQILNRTNLATMGLPAFRLKTLAHWRRLLEQAGFEFQNSAQEDDPAAILVMKKPSTVRQWALPFAQSRLSESDDHPAKSVSR